MPLVPQRALGGRLDPGTVGPRKTPANPTTRATAPPLQLDRWFRNGRNPDAHAANAMNEAANSAVLFRTTEHFSALGLAPSPFTSFGAGDRERWSFAFRSGPYAHAIGVLVIMVPQSSGSSENAHARLDLATNAAGTPVVISETFTHGAAPHTGDSYGNWRLIGPKVITVDPSTVYYATLYDVDYARLLSVTVFELASLTENDAGGYLPVNYSMATAITDADRENQVTVLNNLLLEANGRVIQWGVASGAPLQTASATLANVNDAAETTISSATPGYTLDMSRKARLSQVSTGIPCEMHARGAWVKGASTNSAGGTVVLKSSDGTTIASLVDAWSDSATPSWKSTTLNIPAGVDKYDLMLASDSSAGTFDLYAVSIFEHG